MKGAEKDARMNVVVQIDGREAVPVRAIPFLTQWEVMSPDEVAGALSDDEDFRLGAFVGLRAFRIAGGQPIDIPPLFWENFASRQLKSISNNIEASQITHATGYIAWREAAVKALPPDAFVWRDEYEPRFKLAFSKSRFGGFVRDGLAISGDLVRQRIEENFSYTPFLADPYESLILESLLAVDVMRHEPKQTGVCDLAWSEAQPFIGDSFSPEQFRAGWPSTLEPSRLGNLQFPREGIPSQDMEAINRANGRQHWVMEALTGLCQRGELECKPIQHVRRDASTGKVVLQWRDYLIEPQPFLEWLAKQRLDPSRFIAAWCVANGVSCETHLNARSSAQQVKSQQASGDVSMHKDNPLNPAGNGSDKVDLTTNAARLAAAKDAMKEHGDNRAHAAVSLGISRRTLGRWLDGEASKTRDRRSGTSVKANDPFQQAHRHKKSH